MTDTIPLPVSLLESYRQWYAFSGVAYGRLWSRWVWRKCCLILIVSPVQRVTSGNEQIVKIFQCKRVYERKWWCGRAFVLQNTGRRQWSGLMVLLKTVRRSIHRPSYFVWHCLDCVKTTLDMWLLLFQFAGSTFRSSECGNRCWYNLHKAGGDGLHHVDLLLPASCHEPEVS